VSSLDPLIAGIDFGRVGRAAARFSEHELQALNVRILHALPWQAVESRARAIDPRIDDTLWQVAHRNIERLEDLRQWLTVAHGPLEPSIDPAERDFLTQAAHALPEEPWNHTTWSSWTKALAGTSDRKGRALFLLLRRALTAADHGPEMAGMLPLIGRVRVLARLQGSAA